MLCQLSYTPNELLPPLTPRTILSAYFTIAGDDAGADGAAAFADREAQALVHGDRRDQRRLSIEVLSPGITISVPSGRTTDPVTSVVRK